MRTWKILALLISIARFIRRLATWGTVPVCIINEKLRENVDAIRLSTLPASRSGSLPWRAVALAKEADRRPKLNGGWEAAAPWRSPPPY